MWLVTESRSKYMGFAKDKAKLEGVLLGNLLVSSDYISLG